MDRNTSWTTGLTFDLNDSMLATIGANCPQTSGTAPKLAALSPSPQRGTDLSPKARVRTEHIVVTWFTGEAELAT